MTISFNMKSYMVS